MYFRIKMKQTGFDTAGSEIVNDNVHFSVLLQMQQSMRHVFGCAQYGKCTEMVSQGTASEHHPFFSLLASSSLMALNLSLPILALKAQMIEIANITIGRVQKMILTASCAV